MSWFSQMPSAATTSMKRTSTRATRSVCSRVNVNAEKITAADGEAERRVGERLPPVRERVLHDREVEAPEEDRDEEEDVCGEAVPHGRR